MNTFRELEQGLAAREKPVRVFFRNDDGGWADDRLHDLCDDFSKLALPLDIAVIPDALTTQSIDLITGLIQADEKFAIHQHGFTHANKQLAGRSCEFGSDRNYQQQYDDIAEGIKVLTAAFGNKVDPIFTPPWNRCTNDTVAVLHDLGIQYLSRIVGSDSLNSVVPEMPVAIDWLKKRRGVRLNQAELINHISTHFTTDANDVGVMLHHEHMDQSNRALFIEFIEMLKSTKVVTFHSMMDSAVSSTMNAVDKNIGPES